MNCPPEVAEVVLDILKTGLLRLRGCGWSGKSDCCAIEADHLHNLPDLLAYYSLDKLRYYWDIERIAYLSQSPADSAATFYPLWQQLALLLQNDNSPALVH